MLNGVLVKQYAFPYMGNDTLRTFLRVHSHYKSVTSDTLLYKRGVSLRYDDSVIEQVTTAAVNVAKRLAQRAFDRNVLWCRHVAEQIVFRLLTVKWVFFRNPESDIFERICAIGHLHVVVWCFGSWRDQEEAIFNGFKRACIAGHVHVAKWLLHKHPFLLSDSDNLVELFFEACWYSRCNVAKWLYELTTTNNKAARSNIASLLDRVYDIIARDRDPYHTGINLFFQSACQKGRLDHVIWVHETFGKYFESHNYYDCFSIACRNGHAHVVSWFLKTVPTFFTPSAIPQYRLLEFFKVLCLRTKAPIGILTWLVPLLQMVSPGLDVVNIFNNACCTGRLHVAMFLHDTFSHLQSLDILSYQQLCCAAWVEDHIDTWLANVLKAKP